MKKFLRNCHLLKIIFIKDLHGSWETFTGHHTALYPRSTESPPQSYVNVQWAVNYWISQGCPASKIILGLATYGRSFTLANSNNNGLSAPTSGAGTAGQVSFS